MTNTPRIIGRQAELGQLQRLYSRVQNGVQGVWMIAGEAGVGKTLLAEESLAGGDLKAFIGRAMEAATPPYGPLSAALRDALRQHQSREIDLGKLTPFLSLLLPELSGAAAAPAEPAENYGELLAEAVSQLLRRITADLPAVLFLDDIQWADNATLELLPGLAERLRGAPLLILATYRSDEIPRGHRVRWLRNELRRRRLLQELHLGPLGRPESDVLLARVMGAPPAPELSALIYEYTQGLPLFVEELATALVTRKQVERSSAGVALIAGESLPIPESIRDAVLMRLDVLSEAARKQLEVAAVAGMTFDLELITQLAGGEDLLDELLEHQLIRESGVNRGAFRHALTREAVLSEIMWSRRRSLNRAIAGYLELREAAPGVIAEHWLAANELEKARLALLAAAENSCSVHAYRDAARDGHRALEIWPEGEDEDARLDTLARLAHCAQVSGQLSEAVRALRELLESPLIQSDPRRHGETQRALATIYGLQGSWEQSLAARAAAAQAFQQAGLQAEAATEWLAAAARYTGMFQLKTAVDYCQHALPLAAAAERVDLQSRILALKGNVLAMLGQAEEGIATVHDALSLALGHNLSEAASEAYRRLGSTLEYASEFTSSRDAYDTAYNYCQSQGAELQAQLCLSCMSYVLFRTGDWKRALEMCQEVTGDAGSAAGSTAIALLVSGLIRVHRGEARQARKQLQECLHLSREVSSPLGELFYHWGIALLEESDARPEEAAQHYRRFLEIREDMNDHHDALPGLCAAVTFFTEQGLEKEATLCARVLADIAAASGNSEALGVLAYILGENALLNRNPEAASQQFLQALGHFEKLEIPLEMIRAAFRAGRAFAAAGNRSEAVRHLNTAYRSARNLGARPLAGQIADALHELGEAAEERRDPEAPERAALGGLTRRQVEIARLIADGMTNKEIANKLFLSTRTVEMHVANMLNRLDCRSRSEAVKKAAEMGLLGT